MAAGDAIVGALRVVLGLDTAQYEDGAKKAAKQTESLGKSLETAGAAAVTAGNLIANAISGAASFIVSSMTGAIDKLAELGKAAQRAGADVSEFAAIASVAKSVGVSTDEVGNSLQKLSRNIAEVASGVSNDAAKAFKVLQISVFDNNKEVKNSTQIFAELANRFRNFTDGPNNAALAYALFGKASADTIAVLSQGSEAIQKQKEELASLGIVLDKDTVTAALKTKQEFEKLNKVWDSIVLQLTVALLPKIQEITSSLIQWSKDTKKMEETQTALNETVKFAGEVIKEFGIIIAGARAEVSALVTALGLLKEGEFSKAIDAFGKGEEKARGFADSSNYLAAAVSYLSIPVRAVGKAIYDTFTGNLGDATKALTEGNAKVKDLFDSVTGLNGTVVTLNSTMDASTIAFTDWYGVLQKAGVGAAKQAAINFDEVIKLANEVANISTKVKAPALPFGDLDKTILSLRVQTAELNGTYNQFAAGLAQTALSVNLIDKQTLSLTNNQGQLRQELIAVNTAMLNLQAAKLTQEFLTPWDQFILKLQTISNLQKTDLPISAEIAAAAQMKAAAQMATSYGEAAQAIVSPMASAFKTLAEMNQKYAAAAKAAAIAEALVNTYLGATKAFTALAAYPPLAFAAAAVATAAGLANVAKIAATPFAQGGSFKVGGVGGIDSQLISIKATPGEMVDIRRPGSERSTGSSEITVRGMSPDDIFTGSWLRGLVEALNQGDRDGYKLRFAER